MAGQPAVGQQQRGLHASTVDIDGNGVLIVGPSGSGKSGLALQLLAFGARLVADDQTVLSLRDGRLFATAPRQIAGLIEARGIGILRAKPLAQTEVRLVVDMGCCETDRLPEQRFTELLGLSLPTLRKIDAGYFPSAILRYVRDGIRKHS